MTHIRIPPELVAGIVRHREPEPATVHHGELAVPIEPSSCYAWVSEDANPQELRLLVEQVLKVIASKEPVS